MTVLLNLAGMGSLYVGSAEAKQVMISLTVNEHGGMRSGKGVLRTDF